MSKNNGQELQVSAASSWKPKTRLMALPTGRVVEVRAVDLSTLIMSSKAGNIPDILTPEVMATLEKYGGQEKAEIAVSDAPAMMEFIRNLIAHVMVAPKIVEGEPDYDNGEIAFEDMDLEQEAMFIFGQLMSGVELAAAQRFRPGQTALVADLQPGENIPAVAE